MHERDCDIDQLPTELLTRIIGLCAADALSTCATLSQQFAALHRERLSSCFNALAYYAPDIAPQGMSGITRLALGIPVGRPKIGDSGLEALIAAGAVGFMRSVKDLELYGNGIGPAGAAALGAAFEDGAFPHLVTLDLDDNCIGDVGITALCQASGAMAKLQLLSLFSNEIGAAGGQEFIRTLMKIDGCSCYSEIESKLRSAHDSGAPVAWSAWPLLDYLNVDANPMCGEAGVGQAYEMLFYATMNSRAEDRLAHESTYPILEPQHLSREQGYQTTDGHRGIKMKTIIGTTLLNFRNGIDTESNARMMKNLPVVGGFDAEYAIYQTLASVN